jgi:hypothetical protein
MILRALINFPVDTALPTDAMSITPHYFGSDSQGLADRLKTNLTAFAAVGATKPFTIRIYDATKAPPSYPLATASQSGSPPQYSYPRELALCLSYYSTWNRPSYRGRLYLPIWMLGGGTIANRPSQTQIDACLAFKTVLTSGLPSGTNWVVYSKKLAQSFGVSSVWCDNEWDVMRSRGTKGTARTLGTVP